LPHPAATRVIAKNAMTLPSFSAFSTEGEERGRVRRLDRAHHVPGLPVAVFCFDSLKLLYSCRLDLGGES
jgi:hypothetical protein